MLGTMLTTKTMSQTYQDLANICGAIPLEAHDLIYVAIGCSQKHYLHSGTRRTGSAQEYPPFVESWPGRRLCVLIDPDLEEKPDGIERAGGAPKVLDDCTPHAVAPPLNIFIVLRKHFHWSDDGCRAFLNTLIQRCLRPSGGPCFLGAGVAGPRMIVQDYSGTDIRPYYPLEIFGHAMLPRVLFDITGGDPGCFVDFSKYQLLRDTNGNFVQPLYTPLWKLKAHGVRGKAFEDLVFQRYSVALDSAARCWRAQNGHDEPRDWYAPALVAERIRPLLYAYGISPQLVKADNGDPLISFAAVEEPIFDLCATVGHYMSHEEVYYLLTGTFDDLRKALILLRDLAVEEQKEEPK